MVAGLRSPRPAAPFMPTFVAIRSSSRPPRAASQRPMTASDSPPWWPGTHAEYTSAVSMKLPPAAA